LYFSVSSIISSKDALSSLVYLLTNWSSDRSVRSVSSALLPSSSAGAGCRRAGGDDGASDCVSKEELSRCAAGVPRSRWAAGVPAALGVSNGARTTSGEEKQSERK
jgi:hypothetical protein